MTALHIIVTLKIPRATAALITRCKAIIQAMTDNKATFPNPSPPLTQVLSDVLALDAAETAVKSRTKGTVQTRDEKKRAVVGDLRQLHAYVQLTANATPDHAAVVAQSAGMSVRKAASRTRSDLAAKPFGVSGSVHLVAKAANGNRTSHEWQYSLDGKTWTFAPPSLQARTTIGNLQTGVVTYFRHRPVTKGGPGDWSQPISLLVA